MRRRRSRSATAALCLAVLLAFAMQASLAPWLTSRTAAAAPAPLPLPDRPRLAFTDDRDALTAVNISRTSEDDRFVHDVTVGTVPSEVDVRSATHTGELSVQSAGTYAYVSTRSGPAGDVYVVRDGEDPINVTCTGTVAESHPVVSSDGERVAYAADAGNGFDLWVAELDPGSGEAVCEAPHLQLTTDPADDLWPAWIPSRDRLVFSSTRTDPLGDLYAVDSADDPEQNLTQLTNQAFAETQPAVATLSLLSDPTVWVVFTTSQYRADGSLGVLAIPRFGDDVPVSAPLWRNPISPSQASPDTVQSSEPTWSPDSDEILFTSTRDDPYGDVLLTPVDGSQEDDETDPRILGLLPGSSVPVVATPGVAESHGAWSEYEGSEGSYEASVTVTTRVHDADVSDAPAEGGAGRRTIGATTESDPDGEVARDDSGPTYAPDGLRVAWSAEVTDTAGDSTLPGQVLMVGGAAGADPAPLQYGREPGDLDVDPAWSPDGTRIAFVRHRLAPEEGRQYLAPRIWVIDLATGETVQVTQEPPEEQSRRDVDPTWSPGSDRIAVSRQSLPVTDVAVDLTVVPARSVTSQPSTVTATASVAAGTTGVRLVVRAPFGLSFDVIPPGCRPGAGGVVCEGSTTEATPYVVTMPVRGSAGGHTIRASVTPDGVDPELSDNEDEATLTLFPPPVVDMSVSPDNLFSGGEVTLIANVSVASGVGDVRLRMPIPAGLGLPQTLPVDCALIEREVVCTRTNVSTPVVVRVVITAQAPEVYRLEALVTRSDVDPLVPPATDTATLTVVAEGPGVTAPDPGFLPGPDPGPGPVIEPASFLVAATPLAAITRVTPDAVPGPTQIWVLDANGGNEVELSEPAEPCPADPSTTVPLVGRSPAWSPDGMKIAVERDGSVHLLTLAAETGGPPGGAPAPADPECVIASTQITGILPDGTAAPSRASLSVTQDPAWSPDGSEIAVSGQPAGQPDQQGIYAIRADGTGLREVAQQRGPETEPAFQPYTDLAVTVTAQPPAVVLGNTSTLTAGLTNQGPARASDVELTLDLPPGLESVSASSPDCVLGTGTVVCSPAGDLTRGAGVEYDVVVRGTTLGSHLVTATASGDSPEIAMSNNRDVTTVEVVRVVPVVADLSVDVTLDRAVAWVGGTAVTATFTVRNAGPAAATGVVLATTFPTFTAPTGNAVCAAAPASCVIGALAPEETAVHVAVLALSVSDPPGSGGGSGVVAASVTSASPDPDPLDDTDSAPLVVHQPVLRVLPAVSRPGNVVMAYGTNFPPGEEVALAWTPGITTPSSPFALNEVGALQRQVLIVRHDRLGLRELTATSPSGLFGPVQAELLVVPRSVSPPRFTGRG